MGDGCTTRHKNLRILLRGFILHLHPPSTLNAEPWIRIQARDRNWFLTHNLSITTMVKSVVLLALVSIGQAAYLDKRQTIAATSTASAQYFQISPEIFQGTIPS